MVDIDKLSAFGDAGFPIALEAADEIVTLREKLAAMITLYVDGSNAADEEIARLRAQVESLSADAERLREYLVTIRDTGMSANEAAEHAGAAIACGEGIDGKKLYSEGLY